MLLLNGQELITPYGIWKILLGALSGVEGAVENKELKEIKANKQPIGQTDDPKPFTTHELILQKGDSIYMFTDGYADQFGGARGKKFMYSQLQEKLVEVSELTMIEQKSALKKIHDEWRGDLEQVDDICVIGIKI